MLLCTRVQRYSTPRHGWTSPTTCGAFFMQGELPRRAFSGSLLWKPSIMALTQMWKFWESQSCLGCAESLAWSHHVCDVIPGEEGFSSLSLVSGPERLFWPEQEIRPSLYGSDTMPALQRVASGVTREQLLPSHVGGVLARLALCRDGITMQELFELWRSWQQGSCTWVEPWTGCGGIVQANDERRRAGAALRCILGAVEAAVDWIPGPCRMCWIPTFTSCPTCGGAVCEECRRGGDFCPFGGSSDDDC